MATDFDPNLHDPDPYPPERLAFRSDAQGRPIVIRPRDFLAKGTDETILAALQTIANDLRHVDRIIAPQSEVVRGDWRRFQLQTDVDVLRVVRGLREQGIAAQPNHVYFVGALQARGGLVAAPNMFAPNMFAPNMFAPNMFAPNMFAPNMFAPNMFAGGYGGYGGFGGGGCCCEAGPSSTASGPVPQHAARQAPAPMVPVAAAPIGAANVEVHVIDIACPLVAGNVGFETGELTDPAVPPIVDQTLPGWTVNENHDGWADPAAGHGDFVASVLHRRSGLPVTVWRAAGPLGDIADSALIRALQEVDAASNAAGGGARYRVLNLSLSGYNEDDQPGLPLADQINEMIEAGWVIVAAAGNNASCRLAWPAALPGVVAVGAISRCAPAWFSSFGPWVDASAPGVDIVAQFPNLPPEANHLFVGMGHLVATPDTEQMLELPDLAGWATWSGTSFAAPFVAARIAVALARLNKLPADTAEMKDDIADVLHAVIDDPQLDWVPYYGRLIT